jgi:hypothetical protein
MSTEPDPKPARKRSRPPAKFANDGFVVTEVDGWANLTPEQKLWPVVTPDDLRRAGPGIVGPPPEAGEAVDPK